MKSSKSRVPARLLTLRHGLQLGYTYLSLLIMLAVMAYTSGMLLQKGLYLQRRDAELELLEKGQRLALALERYAVATPQGQSPMPARVEDLLQDPRYPKLLLRHLRRVEIDPMTGKANWGEIRSTDGKGIMGFHSLSEDRPLIKIFPAEFKDFDELPRYRDWVFGSQP